MEIEEALVLHLRGTEGIAALVGDRIYPRKFPQGCDLPVIVYTVVANPPVRAQRGQAGTFTPRFQLDVVARDIENGLSGIAQAKALARQLFVALDDYHGRMGGPLGVEVKRVFFNGDRDAGDDLEVEPDVGVHRRIMEFTIWHGA